MAATIFDVTTASELYAALAKSTGGETIRLAGGDYGNLGLKAAYHNLNYDTPVTIVSADADDPAIISEMRLNGASNISFENITFKSYYTAAATWYEPFTVSESSNISFDNVLFEGTPAEGVSEAEDGTGRGKGLVVSSSTDISVTDSEFVMWHRGMLFSGVDNLTVARNEVHGIRSDGMNFAGVSNTLIEDNYIHDFNSVRSSGDHADMIQFITLGNTASSNIVIRGNTFDIGEGSHVQTLFMTNQAVSQSGAGVDNYYQNITIEDNVILNGHAHGITVGETNGLTLRNNTVLSIDPDDPEFSSTPTIKVAGSSLNVVIDSNVTQSVIGYNGQSDWQVTNNVLVQNTDPQKDGFYEAHFITSTFGGLVDDFTVRPDSEIAELGAGAGRLLYGETAATIEPLFNLHSVKDAALNVLFDASATLGAGRDGLPSGTKFLWDFGDGTTASGQVVQHEYAKSGLYAAELRVVLPDGKSYSETAQVKIAGSAMLSVDTANGTFVSHGYGKDENILKSALVTQTAADGTKKISIGDGGGVSSAPKEALARYFGSDSFKISMGLQADAPGISQGELGRIHNSLMLNTTAVGDLNVILFLDTGTIGLTSKGAKLNDGKLHDIDVIFNDTESTFKIVVDGVEVASRAANGNVEGMKSYGLTLGNAWGKQTFDGQITDFEIDVESYDYLLSGENAADLDVPVSSGPLPEVEIMTPFNEDVASPDKAEAPTTDVKVPDQTPDVEQPVEVVTGEVETVTPKDTGLSDLRIDVTPGFMAKEELGSFFGTDNFEINMTLQADVAGESYGEIARVHNNFQLNATADGGLKFVLWMDTEAVVLSSGAIGINDGEAHVVSVSFDKNIADLSLLVDGEKVGSTAASGSVKGMQYWDLTFGTQWGTKRSFDGDIEDVEISIKSQQDHHSEKWIIGGKNDIDRAKVEVSSMADIQFLGSEDQNTDPAEFATDVYQTEVSDYFEPPLANFVESDIFLV